jgi:hypothetical protein
MWPNFNESAARNGNNVSRRIFKIKFPPVCYCSVRCYEPDCISSGIPANINLPIFRPLDGTADGPETDTFSRCRA